MLNFKISNQVPTEILTLKNDLELNTELQLIKKYQTACCSNYQEAIIMILKERGYSTLEIGHLLNHH